MRSFSVDFADTVQCFVESFLTTGDAKNIELISVLLRIVAQRCKALAVLCGADFLRYNTPTMYVV